MSQEYMINNPGPAPMRFAGIVIEDKHGVMTDYDCTINRQS